MGLLRRLFKSASPAVIDAAINVAPSMPSISAPAILNPQAGFQDGTDGKPRLAWARYQTSYGLGWNCQSGAPYTLTAGGRTSREAGVAASVANDLVTSNPALATITETLETSAVGVGLTLCSKPDHEALGISADEARALSHQIETRWSVYASNPKEVDFSGRFDLHQLAAAGFRSALLNGELVATLDWQRFPGTETHTKVSLLDTRQLDTTITRMDENHRVVNGVAFDTRGRVAGYFLRKLPLGSQNTAPIGEFVAAYTAWGRQKVVHLFELKDPRQVRGLSPLVAALTPAHERESLSEFMLANALLQTQYALTVESDLPAQAAFNGLSVNDQMSGGGLAGFVDERADFYGNSRITPTPGVVNHLAPGDKLKMNKVENPSSNFNEFDKSLTRKSARAAGTSYEDASGDYSQTSFSASRMATELPYRLNVKRRKNLVAAFYQAVFKAWLEEEISLHRIAVPDHCAPFHEKPDAFAKARWLGLGRQEPDRKKAADATIREMESGLLTLEDALAERGIDLETQIENIKQERQQLQAIGLEHPFFIAFAQRMSAPAKSQKGNA